MSAVDDRGLDLKHLPTGEVTRLGCDHIHSFFTDPNRDVGTTLYGFLQLNVTVTLTGTGIDVEPRPHRPGDVKGGFRGNPLVVRDGDHDRLFSWRDRDPVHLISGEEPPRQLLDFDTPLLDALRVESGQEPRFDLADDIRGEVVYESSN